MSTRTGCVTMQIWDTAGQEKYRALAPMYYRSAQVAILCFDLTNSESFRATEVWAEELAVKAAEDLKTIVAGNKAYLAAHRAIDRAQGQALADRHKAAAYFECSAKTGAGIVELFTRAAELLEEGHDTPVVSPFVLAPSAEKREGQCC
jgi:small GTP-binding protein